MKSAEGEGKKVCLVARPWGRHTTDKMHVRVLPLNPSPPSPGGVIVMAVYRYDVGGMQSVPVPNMLSRHSKL